MRRVRRVGFSTTVVLVCAVASACASATARPSSSSIANTTPAPSTALPPTTPTSTLPTLRQAASFHRALDRARPLRVLVVGDSVGITLGRGMQLWAYDTGGAVVRNEARAWCSLGRYLPRDVFGPQNSSAGCDDWGTRWAQLVQTFDPDVVFVMYTVWEVIPRQLPAASGYTRPGNPALDAWQLSEYQHATDVLSARGARVVFFSLACEGRTTIRRGEPYWYVNRRTLPALARSRPQVRLLDLDSLLCGGGQVRNDLGGVHDIRPDDAHFSDLGALALAGWAMPIVLGRAPPPPYALN
jgi:hypothetical protein